MDTLKFHLFMACTIYLLDSVIGFHISAYNRNGLQDDGISPFSIFNPSSYLFETQFDKEPVIGYGNPAMMAMENDLYPEFSDITKVFGISNQSPSDNGIFNRVSKRRRGKYKTRALRKIRNINIDLCRKFHTYSSLYRLCQRMIKDGRNTPGRGGPRNNRR